MDSKVVYEKANDLVAKCGTRDAFASADFLGIEVIPVSYFQDLLGMYSCKWRKRAIFINDRMDEYLTQMVVAHEIGHDIYHRDLAKASGLEEFQLFRMENAMEYEANAFAAHLLIDSDEFLELAQNGYDVTEIACQLNTEINLALIKLQEMIKLGYDLNMPKIPRSDFFRNIKA